MGVKKWLGLWIIALFAVANQAQSASTEKFPKTLTLSNQEWVLENYQEDKNLQIGEYIPKNTSLKDWKQLLTFQKFKFAINKELTPILFAEKERDELKSQKIRVNHTIISANEQEAIVEFRILEPTTEQQDEIQRIILSLDRKLTILHYVVKKADMGDSERKSWITALSNFDIKQLR